MNLFQSSPIATPQAFDQLYQRNCLPVFRYIYGLTGGPQEAVEDLTAETFLRAWKARHRFDGDENNATSWLIRIAKRLVIDDYRYRTFRANCSQAPDPPAEPEPEQIVLERDQRQFLLVLLEGLPEGQREILVLRYMLGWRVSEIARHVGTTENNISVTIHRALTRLREKWQEMECAELPAMLISEENIS
jgi:RNA polymerase sigma-70 factor (ECF subfamily)